MLVSKNLAVNGEGHLTVGGIDTVELAHEYGTPLYVMDEDLIREHCRSFKQSMDITAERALYATQARRSAARLCAG